MASRTAEPRAERRRVTIAVAPNGGRLGRADHPALPLTAGELARAAAASCDVGASMIHMHVRDAAGRHLLDADAYRAAMSAVRGAVGDRLVIQITSEALGLYTPAEQMAVVRATRPEAVSLALRELAPLPTDEPEFAEFLAWLARERIAPQIILYAPEEAARLGDMAGRGLVPLEQIPVLYVLGRYAAHRQSSPSDLRPFLARDLPAFDHWMVCAFGEREAACATAGALLGGHARIGFENNLHLPDGSMARDNAAIVAATVSAIASEGFPIAGVDELRRAWAIGN